MRFFNPEQITQIINAALAAAKPITPNDVANVVAAAIDALIAAEKIIQKNERKPVTSDIEEKHAACTKQQAHQEADQDIQQQALNPSLHKYVFLFDSQLSDLIEQVQSVIRARE